MGKANSVTKLFLNDNEVFADAFNYLIYDGKPVIQPEQLKPLDSNVVAIVNAEEGVPKWIEKNRDVFKQINAMTDGKNAYLILGVENQTDISYIMPVRNMLYDAMEYTSQIAEIAKHHLKNKDTYANNGEFLSGFRKDDKLIPVITLVIYFGAEPWDGPRCIHDMLATTDEDVLALVENYNIHLITPDSLKAEDLVKFKSELQVVLGAFQHLGNENDMNTFLKGQKRSKNMSYEAAQVLSVLAGIKIKSKLKKGEQVDMCKAWDDHYENGRQNGIREGKEEGLVFSVRNVMKKLNTSVESAMEFLDIPKEQQGDIVKHLQSA